MKKLIVNFLFLSLIVFQGKGQEFLSLAESRTLALEYNQKIKIADEMILEGESNIRFAFTQFLPKFSLDGNYNYYSNIDDINLPGSFLPTANSLGEAQQGIYTGTSNVYFPGVHLKMGDIDYYTANLNVSQPIFLGGKIQSAYKISKMGSMISKYNRKLKTSDVLMETDRAYWNLVSIRDKVKLSSRYVEMLTALVRDLQNAFDLELTTKNELLKAQVQLNQAKLNLFRAQNSFVLSRMSLCQVIGKSLNSDIVATDTVIVVNKDVVESDFVAKALAQRPEIEMLGKQVEISQQEVKITRSDYLPQIGVGASYAYMSDVEELMDSRKTLAVKATVSVPVFHWKERKYKVATAKSRSRQKELELERTRDLISLEAQQAFFNLQEANQQIELAEVSLKQANENVDLTQNSFFEGLANTTELLDAQAFWQNAYSELIDAKINYKLKEVNFLKSIGELGNL